MLRLVSKHTVEERIIEIATKKLLLEEIIINPINKITVINNKYKKYNNFFNLERRLGPNSEKRDLWVVQIEFRAEGIRVHGWVNWAVVFEKYSAKAETK